MRLEADLELRQNEIKKFELFKTLKYLPVLYVEEKHALPSRKLEYSKNFFFGVNDCIRQLLLNVSIQENYYVWLQKM